MYTRVDVILPSFVDTCLPRARLEQDLAKFRWDRKTCGTLVFFLNFIIFETDSILDEKFFILPFLSIICKNLKKFKKKYLSQYSTGGKGVRQISIVARAQEYEFA